MEAIKMQKLVRTLSIIDLFVIAGLFIAWLVVAWNMQYDLAGKLSQLIGLLALPLLLELFNDSDIFFG